MVGLWVTPFLVFSSPLFEKVAKAKDLLVLLVACGVSSLPMWFNCRVSQKVQIDRPVQVVGKQAMPKGQDVGKPEADLGDVLSRRW